jgi:hypothetical protein
MTTAVFLLPLAVLVFAVVALAIDANLALMRLALVALELRLALLLNLAITLDLTLAFDLLLAPDLAFTFDPALMVGVSARIPDAAAVRADGLGPPVGIGALNAPLAIHDLAVHDPSVDHAAVDDLTILCVDATLIVVNPITHHASLRRAGPPRCLANRIAVRRVR